MTMNGFYCICGFFPPNDHKVLNFSAVHCVNSVKKWLKISRTASNNKCLGWRVEFLNRKTSETFQEKVTLVIRSHSTRCTKVAGIKLRGNGNVSFLRNSAYFYPSPRKWFSESSFKLLLQVSMQTVISHHHHHNFKKSEKPFEASRYKSSSSYKTPMHVLP